MSTVCSQCNFNNPEGMKFCGGCGSPLQSEPVREPERRTLTVVFCDLVGSTQLSEQLDAEELREILRAYQNMCTKVVKGYDGHVAQFLGDGILIYFGYPEAHEDDAVRAIRASLEITEKMKTLNTQLGLPQVKLAVRIGIETGSVVTTDLGSQGHKEHLALGQTPNVAARLQSLASRNTVIIGEQTRRLVRGQIEFSSLGAKTLKGISLPIQAYQALKVVEESETLQSSGMTLVGRDEEMKLLLQRFSSAANNQRDGTVRREGGAVLLRGDPGIGKSRLISALREEISEREHLWIDAACSAYEQATALHAMTGTLRKMLGFSTNDDPAWKLKQLESGLALFQPGLYEILPYFAVIAMYFAAIGKSVTNFA